MIRKFRKSIKTRPTEKEALEFLSRGYYSIGPKDYISAKDRIEELKRLSNTIRVLLNKEIPKGRNLDLVILKCHILIEFMMNQYINLLSESKVDVTKERFTISQKLTIVHMLGFIFDPLILPSIEIINKLRNQVAHRLTIDRGLIDKLLKINSEDPDTFIEPNDAERAKGIKSITRFICYAFLGVIEAKHIEAHKELLNSEKNSI